MNTKPRTGRVITVAQLHDFNTGIDTRIRDLRTTVRDNKAYHDALLDLHATAHGLMQRIERALEESAA